MKRHLYNKIIIPLTAIAVIFSACDSNEASSDGYGNFESTEYTISAQANGQIMQLAVEEGQQVKKGEELGYIDTSQLALKKKQLLAQREAIHSKTANITAQIEVMEEELASLKVEQQRIENLLRDSAATRQQWDNANSKVAVLKKKIEQARTQFAPVLKELNALDVQVEQVEDQISKSRITSPVSGTVLVQYAEAGEITGTGQPIFKVADLSTMILKIYVGERQLSTIQPGQEVTVLADAQGGMTKTTGTISWISSKAEFTPKIIQTRDERVNLVYAVKIRVPNDGRFKIGMPGEMQLANKNDTE